jgi:hypothetical protein
LPACTSRYTSSLQQSLPDYKFVLEVLPANPHAMSERYGRLAWQPRNSPEVVRRDEQIRSQRLFGQLRDFIAIFRCMDADVSLGIPEPRMVGFPNEQRKTVLARANIREYRGHVPRMMKDGTSGRMKSSPGGRGVDIPTVRLCFAGTRIVFGGDPMCRSNDHAASSVPNISRRSPVSIVSVRTCMVRPEGLWIGARVVNDVGIRSSGRCNVV